MDILDMNDQNLIKNVYALYKKRSNIKDERFKYVLMLSMERIILCYTDIREVDVQEFKSAGMWNAWETYLDDYEMHFASNTIEEMISFCYADYPEYLI